MNNFLRANNLYDDNWQGGRCEFCDRPCKSAFGVKIHQRSCWQRPTQQNFTGTCAEKRIKFLKLKEAQKKKPKIKCSGRALKNVYAFKYLGSIFTSDGDHTVDVKRRIDLAMARMGELRQVFNSEIKYGTKMKNSRVLPTYLRLRGLDP